MALVVLEVANVVMSIFRYRSGEAIGHIVLILPFLQRAFEQMAFANPNELTLAVQLAFHVDLHAADSDIVSFADRNAFVDFDEAFLDVLLQIKWPQFVPYLDLLLLENIRVIFENVLQIDLHLTLPGYQTQIFQFYFILLFGLFIQFFRMNVISQILDDQPENHRVSIYEDLAIDLLQRKVA